MVAVHEKRPKAIPWTARVDMKNKPVQQVLDQGPRRPTTDKERRRM
jgi:hypothetical protein